MATLDDARRIASALPEAIADPGDFAYRVDGRLFTWIWMERVQPKRPRVPNREAIAIRVADEVEKQAMLVLDPDDFSPSRTTTDTRRCWSGCLRSTRRCWRR